MRKEHSRLPLGQKCDTLTMRKFVILWSGHANNMFGELKPKLVFCTIGIANGGWAIHMKDSLFGLFLVLVTTFPEKLTFLSLFSCLAI